MHGSTVVLVSFLISVMTATGTMYVVERYNILPKAPPAAESVVPDLHGMLESDARTNANGAHVALFVASREPSTDAKPGSIIRQSHAPGQHVPRESPVSVVVAEEVLKVPNVANLPVADGTQRLEQRGYVVQVGATTPHPTAALGVILGQAPKADSILAKGGVVTLQVSGGPSEVELPKFVGMAVPHAKTQLESLGLKPIIKWVALAETPTNIVLSQKPAPNEKVKPGSDVQLTACSR